MLKKRTPTLIFLNDPIFGVFLWHSSLKVTRKKTSVGILDHISYVGCFKYLGIYVGNDILSTFYYMILGTYASHEPFTRAVQEIL